MEESFKKTAKHMAVFLFYICIITMYNKKEDTKQDDSFNEGGSYEQFYVFNPNKNSFWKRSDITSV